MKIKCAKHTWKEYTKEHPAVTHKETKSVKIKDAWDEEVTTEVYHIFVEGAIWTLLQRVTLWMILPYTLILVRGVLHIIFILFQKQKQYTTTQFMRIEQ